LSCLFPHARPDAPPALMVHRHDGARGRLPSCRGLKKDSSLKKFYR
jgi:hypothetical protein